jgi:protein-disulfide isomerase
MSRLRIPVDRNDHQTGNLKAKIILVEYGDYQCPHCGIAYPLIKRLLKQFGKELLFVFRNFPLEEIHPAARIAAQAAEAASRQEQFWKMHDLIFENQNYLSPQFLLQCAVQLKLNEKKFLADSTSEMVLSKIENDFDGGIQSGVNGTPSFFFNGNKLNSYDESYDSLAKAFISTR